MLVALFYASWACYISHQSWRRFNSKLWRFNSVELCQSRYVQLERISGQMPTAVYPLWNIRAALFKCLATVLIFAIFNKIVCLLDIGLERAITVNVIAAYTVVLVFVLTVSYSEFTFKYLLHLTSQWLFVFMSHFYSPLWILFVKENSYPHLFRHFFGTHLWLCACLILPTYPFTPTKIGVTVYARPAVMLCGV